MANDLLLINTIAQNIKTVITAQNAEFITKLYDTTIKVIRGKYGFSIVPTEFITREFTDVSSLPNIMLEMFCYYTLDTAEKRDEEFVKFLSVINILRNTLLSKVKIPSPLATVKIDVNFHDDLLDQKVGTRVINGAMLFTYRKYAMDT